jgi:hypothetical protein
VLWPDLASGFPHTPDRQLETVEGPLARLHAFRNRLAPPARLEPRSRGALPRPSRACQVYRPHPSLLDHSHQQGHSDAQRQASASCAQVIARAMSAGRSRAGAGGPRAIARQLCDARPGGTSV